MTSYFPIAGPMAQMTQIYGVSSKLLTTQVAERSKADLPKGSTGPVWSLMFTMALIFSYRVCSAEILTMSSDVNVS